MNTFELRQLSVFDEIYKTASVSRAAENLGLGQPAVSIALGKLREHFKDPLFVRTSAGMEPTPLGTELAYPIRDAIEAMQRAMDYRPSFDASTTKRTFRIAMTDISQLVLLPGLLKRFREIAPNLRIDVHPIATDIDQQLVNGEVDLALGFMPQLEAGFYQQTLFRQHYVCMTSAEHPRIRSSLSLAQFEAEEHAVVTTSGTGHLIIDKEVARQKIQRRVALRLPNFLGMAFIIEDSNLLVTVPTRLGEVLAGRGQFNIFPVPFSLPDYAIKQHWHERFHHDPGNRWLRSVVFDLLSESGEATASPSKTDRTSRPT